MQCYEIYLSLICYFSMKVDMSSKKEMILTMCHNICLQGEIRLFAGIALYMRVTQIKTFLNISPQKYMFRVLLTLVKLKKINKPCLLLIFSQSDNLILIVFINLHT